MSDSLENRSEISLLKEKIGDYEYQGEKLVKENDQLRQQLTAALARVKELEEVLGNLYKYGKLALEGPDVLYEQVGSELKPCLPFGWQYVKREIKTLVALHEAALASTPPRPEKGE